MMSEKYSLYSLSPEKHASCLTALRGLFQGLQPIHLSDTESASESDDDASSLTYPTQLVCGAASRSDSTAILLELRLQMDQHHLDAYIIPSEDEHQSEYTAEADKRRGYVSGFTGSAGVAVVTTTLAALATDGRYFLQAKRQLDHHWELLKQGTPNTPSWQEWTVRQLETGTRCRVGVDPRLVTKASGDRLVAFFSQSQTEVVFLATNLVDTIWTQRPKRSVDPLFVLPEAYSGEGVSSKLERVRRYLDSTHTGGAVVSALDDIAWLYNLRGSDIEFTPVFFAYSVVTPTEAVLYLDEGRLSEEVKTYLAEAGVSVRSYNTVWKDLGEVFGDTTSVILPESASYALALRLPLGVQASFDSVIERWKAVKNTTELQNAQVAQTKDSVATIQLFAWLEAQLRKGRRVTEWDAAVKIDRLRQKQPHYKGLSYETISSSGPNGAIIHYAPTATAHAVIDPNQPYLLDSGAQYLEGTTDITRTAHFGKPTAEQKRYYTAVLQGHLNLSREVFPGNGSVTGQHLDILARTPLWRLGVDYKHGTGHGVGSFLGVHEGPVGIGSSSAGQQHPARLAPGNILSNEPGFYVDGAYGIRIESELAVVETEREYNGIRFWGFDYLTKVPFARNMINWKELSAGEREWIERYYSGLRRDLKPRLLALGDHRAWRWLERETLVE